MKIGLGITTFERFNRFKECFEHALKHSRDVTEIIIVDDCSVEQRALYDEYFATITVTNRVKVFVNKENIGVGPSKNKILKYFYDKNFDYIFTLEDDINIISDDVFASYIKTAEESGFEYLNFGLHGQLNKGRGVPMKLPSCEVMIFPNIVGAFSLHSKNLINTVGFYDEEFFNAWEHVDYAFMVSKAGLAPAFWLFPDVINSHELLVEQEDAIKDSSIRPRTDWGSNIKKGNDYFKQKHGVTAHEIPRV